MTFNKSQLDYLLHEVFSGSHEPFDQVIHLFLQGVPKSIQDIKSEFSTEEKTTRKMRHHLHHLKSSCITMGADQMALLCQEWRDYLETSSSQLGACQEQSFTFWIQRLEKEFANYCEELEQEFHFSQAA